MLCNWCKRKIYRTLVADYRRFKEDRKLKEKMAKIWTPERERLLGTVEQALENNPPPEYEMDNGWVCTVDKLKWIEEIAQKAEYEEKREAERLEKEQKEQEEIDNFISACIKDDDGNPATIDERLLKIVAQNLNDTSPISYLKNKKDVLANIDVRTEAVSPLNYVVKLGIKDTSFKLEFEDWVGILASRIGDEYCDKYDRDTIITYIVNHYASWSGASKISRWQGIEEKYRGYLKKDPSPYTYTKNLLTTKEREFVAANPKKNYRNVQTGEEATLEEWVTKFESTDADQWKSINGFRHDNFMKNFHDHGLVEYDYDCQLWIRNSSELEWERYSNDYYKEYELMCLAAQETWKGNMVAYSKKDGQITDVPAPWIIDLNISFLKEKTEELKALNAYLNDGTKYFMTYDGNTHKFGISDGRGNEIDVSVDYEEWVGEYIWDSVGDFIKETIEAKMVECLNGTSPQKCGISDIEECKRACPNLPQTLRDCL